MQDLDKILKEIEKLKQFYETKAFSLMKKNELPYEYDEIDIESAKVDAILDISDIICKHINDGWISVEERLPEDVYTSSELDEKWFLITNTCGEEKLVQRMECVPSGYVWHDGYDTHRAVAWGYIEPYKPKRREKS